ARRPPFATPFDAVLVDAPCSGLGTLRRHPELRWRRRAEDIARLAALQREILAGAAPLVRPGGVLVYAVCTLARQAHDDRGDWIHVDVMDGRFVPPITIGPLVVAAIRRATHLPLDVHLMIETPEKQVAEFVRAGADGVTVHVEASTDVAATLAAIRTAGARPG